MKSNNNSNYQNDISDVHDTIVQPNSPESKEKSNSEFDNQKIGLLLLVNYFN
jgi:hypothetical protein